MLASFRLYFREKSLGGVDTGLRNKWKVSQLQTKQFWVQMSQKYGGLGLSFHEGQLLRFGQMQKNGKMCYLRLADRSPCVDRETESTVQGTTI